MNDVWITKKNIRLTSRILFSKAPGCKRASKSAIACLCYISFKCSHPQHDWLYLRWADTDEKKWEYVRLYNEREGIALDMEKIEKSLGRKVTAKLMLNSFWGKFGEEVNKLQLQKYTKAYQLLDVVHNKIVEISNIWFLNSEVVEVAYRKIDEDAAKGLKTTSS